MLCSLWSDCAGRSRVWNMSTTTRTFPSSCMCTNNTTHNDLQRRVMWATKRRQKKQTKKTLQTVKPGLKSSTRLRNTLTSLLRLSLPLHDCKHRLRIKGQSVILYIQILHVIKMCFSLKYKIDVTHLSPRFNLLYVCSVLFRHETTFPHFHQENLTN